MWMCVCVLMLTHTFRNIFQCFPRDMFILYNGFYRCYGTKPHQRHLPLNTITFRWQYFLFSLSLSLFFLYLSQYVLDLSFFRCIAWDRNWSRTHNVTFACACRACISSNPSILLPLVTSVLPYRSTWLMLCVASRNDEARNLIILMHLTSENRTGKSRMAFFTLNSIRCVNIAYFVVHFLNISRMHVHLPKVYCITKYKWMFIFEFCVSISMSSIFILCASVPLKDVQHEVQNCQKIRSAVCKFV